jgi:hypothetical protein
MLSNIFTWTAFLNGVQQGKTIGLVTKDVTLWFQIINTLVLLAIVIGIPLILIKILKASRIKDRKIEELNMKIDSMMNELDKRAE